MNSAQDIARAVLGRYGTTFASEAGISLADEPVPLFQLLVLTELLSARISAGVAVAAALELRSVGLTTPARMGSSTHSTRVAALGRGGYRRYDERTATQLGDAAHLVLDRYSGDLRGLGEEAGQDVDAAARLLQEFKGIGPTGASVFIREVQQVWPWARPYLDDRTRSGALRVGLPESTSALAGLVSPEETARFAAGLVRISLLPAGAEPLADGARPPAPQPGTSSSCDGVTPAFDPQED